MNQAKDLEAQIVADCARFYADPVGFARWAFDWGYGQLEGYHGLDTWQEDFLQALGDSILQKGFNGIDPVLPTKLAVASGHGIGKSALTAITILWLMSTRPFCRGTVTANTGDQLRTKTWSELAKWKGLCITGHWFEYNNSKGNMNLYHGKHPDNWRVDAVTCREENSEAFAGQHNSSSTSFYLFDEASAVPDKIWEVAMGGLTDGEPVFLAFGNPTKNTGFFRQTFSDSTWMTRQIDSRSVARTNKALLNEWIEQWGEDSDFVRVRIKGQFPNASDLQFFPSDKVSDAIKRPLPRQLGDEPLICGIDYSRGGNDKAVIQFRRGRDARSEKRYEIPGEKTRDSIQVAALIATVLDRHLPDVTFGDVGSMGGSINDRLRQLGYNVVDVGFGHKAQDEGKFSNRTAEMSSRLLDWLHHEGCLPNVPELEQDLTGREFTHDAHDRLLMERKKDMKKRLGRSPDDMDALLLTFATKVTARLSDPRDDRPVGARGTAPVGDPLDAFDVGTYRPLDNWDQ